MKSDLNAQIKLPKAVNAEVNRPIIKITGPKGTVEKKLSSRKVEIAAKSGNIELASKNATLREKKLFNTYRAHLIHMIVGALEGHTYKLKICSGHFPMNVSLKGDTLEVKNFLGETNPRKLKIKNGVDVKVNGDEIVVESPDKEYAGQTAADIEQLTRITRKDRRIFQDGIYIIEKSKCRPIPVDEE